MTACAAQIIEPGKTTTTAVEITTARLVLRPLVRGDLSRLVQLGNDFAVAKNLSRFPYPYKMADAEEWFALQSTIQAQGEQLALAVTLKGELIGGIGLGPVHTPQHELGYWLGQPYWGQGFATEASVAVLDYGFDRFGLGVIAAAHFADNHASGRVLTKLGFRYTIETNRYSRARGCDVRSLEMALPRGRWAQLRQGDGSH